MSRIKAISPSSRSGQEARAAKTRDKLIKAAIEEFGAIGYDAASTRILTQKANANLAAIPYHFGGKRELYLAAAHQIAEYAQRRLEEATGLLREQKTRDPLKRIENALLHLLHIVLDDAEPRSWTFFLARCTFENDEAFVAIYDHALAPFERSIFEIAKTISPGSSDADTIRLRVSTIVTTIVSFRLLRGLVLRGMDWKEIRSKDTQKIDAMVRDLIRRNFLTPQAIGPSKHRRRPRD